MVVNGNGKPEANNRKLDQDNFKNYGARINQGVGDFMTLGGFLYSGKEKETATGLTNQVTIYGPDMSLAFSTLEFTGQLLFREDDNPLFVNNSSNYKSTGVVAELMFAPPWNNSNHNFTLLYNMIDSDVMANKYETITFSASYLFARNLRFLAEYTRDLYNERNRAVFGIIGAF